MPVEKMRVVELCDLRKAKLEAALKAKKEKDALLANGVELPEQIAARQVKTVKPVLAPLSTTDQGGSLDLF
jgi:hypothetical protein